MISNVNMSLVYKVASKYVKEAEDIAIEAVSLLEQDRNLLQNILGEEGLIKLAEIQEREGFRMPQEKAQFFKAPEHLKKSFAQFIVMTLEKAADLPGHHFTHITDKNEGESDEDFENRKLLREKVLESLNNFYELASNDLSKRLPKELAKKFNDAFANKRFNLFLSPSEAKTSSAKPILSIDLQRHIIGEGGKLVPVSVKDAVEAFGEQISRKPDLKYLQDKFNGKPQQSDNLYSFPSGLTIRTTELPSITDSDIFIKASGSKEGNKEFHDAMSAIMSDMLIHYMKEDSTALKNMILDSVLGEVKEKTRPPRAKGKEEPKTVSEREEKKLELSENKFVPRIDKERRKEILELLKKKHGITDQKTYIPESENYEVGMVDKVLVSYLNNEVKSFEWKLHSMEQGQRGGTEDKFKPARLEFIITDKLPGVRPDRIFNIDLPSYISDIEGGKTYTFEVTTPNKDNDKTTTLKFKEFASEEAEEEFKTIADKGLNPDEIKKLAQKMVVNYSHEIASAPLSELIEKLSGTIFIGNEQVYEVGDLSSAMGEKEAIIPRGREEAVEEAKRREQEEEEGKEKVKEFVGGKQELAHFLLSQGVRKPAIVKIIANKFPITPKFMGQTISPLLKTRRMINWVLELISKDKTPPTTKGTDPWMNVAVNELITGKAFTEKNAQDLLINIIKMFKWEEEAKNEMNQLASTDPGFDRSAYMKKKRLEMVQKAKNYIQKNENEIYKYYSERFKNDIRTILFSMLVKDKDKNLMTILDNAGYRDIVEEVAKGEPIPEKPSEIDTKKPGPSTPSDSVIVDAILRRDFEKLRSMGLKVTDKTEALMKTMRTMDKDGKPLPKEQWTSALSNFISRAVTQAKKRTEKTNKAEMSKKIDQLKGKWDKEANDCGMKIYNSLMTGIPVIASYKEHFSNIIHLICNNRKGI
jgi:hypothetical protein